MLLAVHPCGVGYDPGDLPPWINLLRVYAKLPQSQWPSYMKQLAADAKGGKDADFVDEWFEGEAMGHRALALARRLLPDFFAPDGPASGPKITTTSTLSDADALAFRLLQRELGLSAGGEQPMRPLKAEVLSLQVLLVGSEGVPCKLDLQVFELSANFAHLHGALVRAPGAVLLELGSDFEAGLVQVQTLLKRLLAPAVVASEQVASPPLAIAWSLRALDKIDGSGNNVTPLLSAVTGPSLTAACAVACLCFLRDHLAEPWRATWHKVLRELDMKRFCATAALQGYESPAPHMPLGLDTDPLQWPLATVGKATLKLDSLGKARPNWADTLGKDHPESKGQIKTVFVAEHQEVSGNVVACKKWATLSELILSAHEMSEPLRLPEDFEALHSLLIASDEAPVVPQDLLDAVHRTPLPKWLKAGVVPSDVDAEKVLRVWWLKRYAHWASGRYQAFGPLRDGGKDEPVALTEHFHPIAIDPEPARHERLQGEEEPESRTREPLTADSLPELFQKCPGDSAFRLHAAPAGGKTTLLAHHELFTALNAIRRFHRTGQWGELALWLPMRDYPARQATDSIAAMDALWVRVKALYPDVSAVLQAWRDGLVQLPGLRLRWLCDAVNEIPAEGDDQRRQAQSALYRGLMEQGAAHDWLPPVFTVRTHSQNPSLAGARGCTLLTWDAPSRLRYMEKRLGVDSPAFHTLRAAIDADSRDDREKFFATPGHLAAQCTLMQAGIVSEPAKSRAQLFCTLLWLRLAQELERGQLPTALLSDDELDRIDRLHERLAKEGGWRWPRQMGPLMQALSSMAVYQQHLDSASRSRQRQAINAERVWSMSAPKDWLLKPPHLARGIELNGLRERDLLRAAQNLNLLQADEDETTWHHQLWLELAAALGLNPGDGGGAWIDTPVPVLPEMEELWKAHQAAGKPRNEFRIPTVPPLLEEETLRYLIQLRGDVVKVVERVLKAGNAPLAARLALENWAAFGEPLYPQVDPLGPWRPERKEGETAGTHPVLNRLRRALHERMYNHPHIASRVESGDLLGQIGGSPLYEICGQALILKDEHWMPIGRPGQPYRFEMGDLEGGENERTAEGELLPVSLPPFHMSGHVVTNAQYHCFVQSGSFGDKAWWPGEAGAWWAEETEADRQPRSLRQTDTDAQGLTPVACYFWQAQAYALWEQAQRERAGRSPGLQLRLPTEAQWEGAARWRFAHAASVADVKPWHFNHDRVIGYCASPVGVFLHSRARHEGRSLHDLAGNVWEWCASPLNNDLGKRLLGPQVDRVASGGELRALRGGGYNDTAAHCRVGVRVGFAPDHANFNFGFRLVWAVVL